VAIGQAAGQTGQGTAAVAIGQAAGQTGQGGNAVAIGSNAGLVGQLTGAIAIGFNAGFALQGTNAIAIGQGAGQTNQPNNSIVINATGTSLSGATASATYINPIRSDAAATTLSLLLYNPTTFELMTSSANTSAGSKTFVIDHPMDGDRYLVHSCLEGPEAGVYYRGTGRIVNGRSCSIALPRYVEHLAYNFSVQLTPLFNEGEDEGKDEYPNLQATMVKNNKFTVYGDTNCEFYWFVNGSRMDIDVEPLKAETVVKGEGPYKWI